MSLSTHSDTSLESDVSNKNIISSTASQVLVVRAKWSWEKESKILKLNPFDTVINGMSAEGFSASSSFGLSDNSNFSNTSNIITKKSTINTMSTSQNIKYFTIQELQKLSAPEDETKVFYICNGKILLDDVSFDYQGVKSGMMIIAHAKVVKKIKNEKKLRFLQTIKNSSFSNLNVGNAEPHSLKKNNFGFNIDQHMSQNQQMHIQIIRKAANDANLIDQSRRSEISRLNDLAFNAWETMPEYPTLLKEMLKNEEEENKNSSTSQKKYPVSYTGYDFSRNFYSDQIKNSTVLKPASQINDQPLPNPFIRKNSLSNSQTVKPIEGDFPNVSHTERKNHFSKSYKKQNKSE